MITQFITPKFKVQFNFKKLEINSVKNDYFTLLTSLDCFTQYKINNLKLNNHQIRIALAKLYILSANLKKKIFYQ
jgi:hypothetical protein